MQFITSPCEVKYMSLHQYRETVPDWPCCLSWQFTEVLYSNPDCEKQCKGLPYCTQYPGHVDQKLGVSIHNVTTSMGAREDELIWCSSHQSDTLKYLIRNWSLHPKKCPPVICITPSTTQAIWRARKNTTRKMSNFRDCWYMACNRTIVMTWMIFQSSQYYWDMAIGIRGTHHPAWHLQ